MIIGEMPTDRELPVLMIQAQYPDGTSRRVIGEVCDPEDLLVMVQSIANQRILPPSVGLALIRHEENETD